MNIDGKEIILFDELSQFEQDKRLFTKYWTSPLYSEAWRKQVFENYYIPQYNAHCEEDLVAIFGEYVVWKLC
jgi:hypothetical protein